MKPFDLLLQSFQCVTQSVLPQVCVKDFVPRPPQGRLIVVGAGKASAAMAAAFEQAYDGALEGLVITRYGHRVPTRHIRILEAAHPVPDAQGRQAVLQMLDLLATAQADDLVVCLMSGGGSSLLSCPVAGVSFDELQALQRGLLGSGASIAEMNIVRKHLNIALGGGLAQAAAPAKVITLAISDVVGDDPQVIASGASVGDATTLAQAKHILQRYALPVTASVEAALNNPAYETPEPEADLFTNHRYHLIATPGQALNAAQDFWQQRGFYAHIWDADLEGDTQEAAQRHINDLLSFLKTNPPLPCAILSGGETTMTLQADSGKGGPNAHFMLQAALLLQGHPQIYGMACDTDGIDGNGDHAGAWISPGILQRAQAKGLNPAAYLQRQDSYHFFEQLDSLVKTGPSFTNVNDYRVFLLLP